MENLNEIKPKKHKIVADSETVIETDNISEAQEAWKPAHNETWEWYRDGELVQISK